MTRFISNKYIYIISLAIDKYIIMLAVSLFIMAYIKLSFYISEQELKCLALII